METLLIDFKLITNKNLQLLENKIAPIPSYSKNQFLGVVFVVPPSILDYLESVDDDNKITYINTITFLSNIKTYLYILYDKNKKLCEIRGKSDTFLQEITSVIMGNIPNDVLLFTGVDIKSPQLNSIIDSYIKEGFGSPFVAKSSPLGYIFENYGLCMLKTNNILPTTPNMSNEIKYVLAQFLLLEHDACEVTVQFNQDTIKYLKQLTHIGSTVNKNGDISQKEIAGVLEVDKTSDDLTHILKIKYDSIIYGQEEGVEIAQGLYNFHSHPISAYKRHNVKLAWPSAQDYLGYILAVFEDYTICHFVIGIEGVYIISMTTHWLMNIKTIDKSIADFIMEEYDYCYKSDQTSEWYIQTVNNINYRGFPLFNVKYLSWENVNQRFTVKYRPINSNCFAAENTLMKYGFIYN